MTQYHEPLFKSAFRSFLVAFFGIAGIAVGLACLILPLVAIYHSPKKESFSKKVSFLPDANGNRKELSSSTPLLLQISLDGKIGADQLTGKKIEEILLDAQEGTLKNRVKGVLLMINSPGGGVNDSDMISRSLKEFKERYRVPVYAYVNGLCASGGYYIAVIADKIYASDVSLIGSIGVLSWPPFVNVADALEKIGVDSITVSAGKGKDAMNPFREWGPDEQKQQQELIDYYYLQFVNHVTAARPILNRNLLIEEWGAHVFPAPRAEEMGLIDGCHSTRSEVVKELAKAAAISEGYQVVGFETKSWWRRLFSQNSASWLFSGKIKHEIVLPHENSPSFNYLYVTQ
jgi:protease IV